MNHERTAMLEHLMEILPESRSPALRKELMLLGKGVKREFLDIADREMVSTGDRQGVGGTTSGEDAHESPAPRRQPR